MTLADLAGIPFERVRDLQLLTARTAELVDAEVPFVLLAGGTDWLVQQQRCKPHASGATPIVLDISQLSELRGITLERDVLRIGAATRFLEMRRHPGVLKRAPLLERVARDMGALQIQARATFGGNLATQSPAADGVAALAAYDAILVLRSRRGERRIPFSELQTGYKTSTRMQDEVFVAVEIFLPPAESAWTWRKVAARKAQAVSKVALAAVAETQGDQLIRCGLGMASVAPVTAILQRTRELFLSTRLARLEGEDLDKAVEADILPISDIRSTEPYRLHVAKALVRDFARSLGAPT